MAASEAAVSSEVAPSTAAAAARGECPAARAAAPSLKHFFSMRLRPVCAQNHHLLKHMEVGCSGLQTE